MALASAIHRLYGWAGTFADFVRSDGARALKTSLSFLVHYCFLSIFMDIEWLLSTLFDASLLSPSSRRQRRLFFYRTMQQLLMFRRSGQPVRR